VHQVKHFAALLGFVLALAGMALGRRGLVWAAIACLVVSFLVRVYLRRLDSAA
jgi:hypothetical protein